MHRDYEGGRHGVCSWLPGRRRDGTVKAIAAIKHYGCVNDSAGDAKHRLRGKYCS